jgi:methylisocitrate lyase
VAALAQERLFTAIARDGGAQNCVESMLTRKRLYETIDYAGFEALDATIVTTVVPEAATK